MQSAIRFKVELRRHDRDTVFHRFSGAYSYSELSTVISHLWGERPKHLVLDYTDDEGDQVRFATEAEWQECVRLFSRSSAPLLRLTGQRVKEVKGAKQQPDSSCSSSSSSDEPEGSPLADVSTMQKPHPPSQSHPLTSMPVMTVPSSSATPHTVETSSVETISTSLATTEEESPEPAVEVNSGATAVDLMSLVYNCDAGEELFKGAVEKFNNVVTRIVDPANPGEVHLDIDRSKLFRDTVFKSSEFMNKKKDLPQAEHLVRTAMEVFPDNVHLQYKLACVLSRRNQLEECLDMLLIAQANGFDETSKLQTDADLANVRKHPRFVEVLPSDDVIDYYDEVDPNPPAAPMEPRRVIKGDDADVRSLLTMFPDMTIDEATCVLVLAEGSLIRAINARISGDYARPGYAKANNSGYAYAPPSTTSCYTSRKERRVEKRRLEMAGKK